MADSRDPTRNSPEGPVHRTIPDGDERERLMCRDCGFIHYENPKVVTGAVVTWRAPGAPLADEQVLMCRRAIAPRDGFWTLPAGYLELGESAEAGAIREAREEACAEIVIDRLLAVYSVVRISQVQTIYRARLLSPDIAAGVESREVALFRWEAVPWDEIAFPTVHWALRHYLESRDRPDFAPFANPPDETAD
jgi:ADP-ribose pyrophosphatase YjhB (NUDIX family)